MNDKLRAYFALHFCVFLWGFTAILGKLITLGALPLVWWRVFLCCGTLWWLLPKAQLRGLPSRLFWQMLGIGAMVGVHWICFYGAIKLSNASIAVATMATTSFFSALLEPLMLRQNVKWYELALGIFILPGMALVVGNIDWSMRAGFAAGILGALLAAIFTGLNKRLIDRDTPPPLTMSFVEIFGGLAVCSLVLPFVWAAAPQLQLLPGGWDWLWMLLLAWVCTLLPYYLTLQAMRHISAFATNLTINLEPVYGVVLAGLFFQEHKDLAPGFYIGVGVILVAVFSHPFLKNYFEKPGKNLPPDNLLDTPL
ncbi:MAG: EamA family transporter [Saprospirales bacterium]|nr:EamA family transporter [Saprospirales bacterium]MBK8922548.1 EamA family transporter [Saprospirales bacterium]